MPDEESYLIQVYHKLYQLYGPQGWWPLMGWEGENPTKTGSIEGYHPLNYSLPESNEQIFEIILGAILTQNTTWTSAVKALGNLKNINSLYPEGLLDLKGDVLRDAVRPAGFFNQKSVYLQEISRFFMELDGKVPTRKELLGVKGVGNETADSILLYAYHQPEFVVDAYTKRIFNHLGVIKENRGYQEVKNLFEESLPRDVPLYQEYHALIVEHAKRYYQRKPYHDIHLK
ncbi:MAG: endonuclease III domain-containing protein [Methanobacteriaceae archaeon]